MPKLHTVHFGTLDYDEQALIEFPAGLPAFDQERLFLPFEPGSSKPFLFLQSLARPDLVFVTLPVELIDPAYQLTLAPEDLALLGVEETAPLRLGREVLCLVIVTLREDRPPTANLMSPLVVNLANRRAAQVIQTETGYSHQHSLAGPAQEVPCS